MPSYARIYQVTRNNGVIDNYMAYINGLYDSAPGIMNWAVLGEGSEPKDASFVNYGDSYVTFWGLCVESPSPLDPQSCKVYKVQYAEGVGGGLLKTIVVAQDFTRLQQWAQTGGFTLYGGVPLEGNYKNLAN